MAKVKKRSPAEITEALLAAVNDVRTNGRKGRSVPEIATQHGVNVGSLRVKLFHAGLTKPGATITDNVTSGEPAEAINLADNIEPATALHDSSSGILRNPFIIKGETELSTKLVENRGSEGVTSTCKEVAFAGNLQQAKSTESESDAAISAVKKEVLTECKRLLKEARRMTEIKSVRDYKTIADLALSMLGDTGKASSSGKSLIQVNILADSGSRSPKSIAAIEVKATSINDHPNESPVIDAETLIE